MRAMSALFADYGSDHRTPGKQWFHRFGIPMIVLSLFGMLARVPVLSIDALRIDLAVLLIVATAAYSLVLDWILGAAMLAASFILYLIGAALPFWANVAVFIAGWMVGPLRILNGIVKRG